MRQVVPAFVLDHSKQQSRPMEEVIDFSLTCNTKRIEVLTQYLRAHL
jgi:hypothetical protein